MLPDYHYACPCGSPLRSIPYLLFDYPRYANKRRELKMTRRGRHPMVQLFTFAAPAISDFLNSTRLAFRPEKGVGPTGNLPFDPRMAYLQAKRMVLNRGM